MKMAKSKPIFIPGTNKAFASASAAAKELNVNVNNIYKVLSGKRHSAGGYKFAYEHNRVIHVPQTGQIFSDAGSAARSLGVRKNRVRDVLSGKRQSVGGYTFIYADNSSLPTTQQPAESKQPNKQTNKQQRIRAKRAKKNQKYQSYQEKQNQRMQERHASAQQQQSRKQKQIEEIQQKYEKDQSEKILANVIARTQSIRSLMDRINDQLLEYDAENLLGYSRVAQNVEAFQDYLGMDGWLFDTSIENMKSLAEMDETELVQWERQLESATNAQNGLFWNIKKQKEERDAYAVEFGVSSSEMDAYVDILPDLWRVFKIARYDDMYERVGQDMWESVQGAVQHSISPTVLNDIIDRLESYWNGQGSAHLQDIIGELDYYQNNTSIFDSDDLPF